MPRKYRRQLGSRPYKNYTPEHLNEALNAIRSKQLSYRQASERFQIHKNTLWTKINGKVSKSVGRQKVFTDAEEECFIAHAVALSIYGYPLTTFDLRCVVKSYLDRCGRTVNCFNNNLPGPDWADSFMNRHKDSISQRTAKNISYARAGTNQEVVNSFFDNLETELRDVPPENIWNYDETNLVDDPGNKKIITKRGCKYPEQIRNSSKACTSIMVCGNAAGELAPLYVNYKAQNLWTTWTEGGPHGTRYNRTKSGWFDHQCFEDWFCTLMLPLLKKQYGTKVLIGDNLSSHINLEVLRLCEENNIKFIALPPNSTHLLQPLDVAYFRPMKIHWRNTLSKWKETTSGSHCTSIPKDEFPHLLKELMDSLTDGNSKENMKAGFRKTGIWPIDRTQPMSRLPQSVLDDTQMKVHIGDSFLDKVENKRRQDTEKKSPRRRKNVTVAAGRSIGTTDVLAHNDGTTTSIDRPSGLKRKKQLRRFGRKKATVESSDEEGDSFSLQDTDDSMGLNLSDSEHENIIQGPSVDKTVDLNCDSITVGKYVLVMYEGNIYPGVITQKVGVSGYLVSAMCQCKKGWKWPEKKDEIRYDEDEIVQVIAEPKSLNRRGVYSVPEVETYREKQ